jgi:hypothetical protein
VGDPTAPVERPGWRRWPVRVLVGVVLLAAIGLLWPFAGWSWWPIAGGFGMLVLLYLLRLDRLLFGWAPHLAGLVTVVLMAARSDPWAWGLAAGIAVLGVGLARLPDRRMLLVGAALVLVFGLGYGVAHYRGAEQRRQEEAQAAAQQATNVVAIAPELLPRVLARGIATGDGRTTCDLLGAPARDQLAASMGAPDCVSAVARLAGQVSDPTAYAAPRLPPSALVKRPGPAGQPGSAVLDGCQVSWPTPNPGPPLGQFSLNQYQQTDRYVVTGYTPCR